MVWFAIFAVAISFYFLAIITDEYFLHAVDFIAKKFNVNSGISGATFLAVGSSAPEFFIAIFAVLVVGNHAAIGIATIVGSSLFNMFVIVGFSAMFNHARLTWQSVVRDLLFYIFAIALLLASISDGVIEMFEALQFVGIYVIYIYSVFHWEVWFGYKFHDKIQPQIVSRQIKRYDVFGVGVKILRAIYPAKKQGKHMVFTFLLSIVLIGLFSFVLVESTISISADLNVPEVLVALVLLAIGTSIPDLLSSIFVAREGREDMAISNAIGSNVFNILAGLGVPWLFVIVTSGGPVVFKTTGHNLLGALILLLIASVMVLGVMIFNKWKISKKTGIVLILSYVIYVQYLVTVMLVR